jgi:16S rRNA (cytosine967-C5)-methyltransferase
MRNKKNVREVALDILEAVEKNQAYSNLLLNQSIEKENLPKQDIGLLTELTYGTIQRQLTLDYYLNSFLKKKTDRWVNNLLRLSVYQMIFLDKIPDRAIIHEAVEIAKKRGHKGISGLVNGVLRSIQRSGVPSIEEIKDPMEQLSIKWSHPKWLVKRWVEQFGIEKTEDMCEENLRPSVQTARVNTTLTNRQAVIIELTEEGYEVEESEIVPVAIRSKRGNLAHSISYKQGHLTIQDESSMLVAYALDPKADELVLDACAAPGGKTTHMSERMSNKGEIKALDIHKHKIKLIDQNASRLHLTNVHSILKDSRQAKEEFDTETFDRILIDAPCSGLGVLKGKPDIKYAKKESDLEGLQTIQLNILNEVSSLLKPGGILAYSTCTIDQKENQDVIKQFLQSHSDFEPHTLSSLPDSFSQAKGDFQLQVFPQDFGGDGFYIAVIRKKE